MSKIVVIEETCELIYFVEFLDTVVFLLPKIFVYSVIVRYMYIHVARRNNGRCIADPGVGRGG